MNRLEIENDWLDTAANWLDNPAPFYLGADTATLVSDPIGLDTDPTAELAALLAEAKRLDLDYLTILALRLDTAGFTF